MTKAQQLQNSYNRISAHLMQLGGGQKAMGFSVFEVLTKLRDFATVVVAKPRVLGVDESASLWVMSDLLGQRNWARQALLSVGELQWANRYYPLRKQHNTGKYDMLVGVQGVGGGGFFTERHRRVSRLNTMSLALVACGGHTNNSRRYLLNEHEKI